MPESPTTSRLAAAVLAGTFDVVAGQGSASSRLTAMGYESERFADPYALVSAVCGRPDVYPVVVLGLRSLFPEELAVIDTLLRYAPGVVVWVTETEGRARSLADAIGRGAGGILTDVGLSRFDGADLAPPQIKTPEIKTPEMKAPDADAAKPPPVRHRGVAANPKRVPKEVPNGRNGHATPPAASDARQAPHALADEPVSAAVPLARVDGSPLLTPAELRALLCEPPDPSDRVGHTGVFPANDL